jgi:hypothetical protein
MTKESPRLHDRNIQDYNWYLLQKSHQGYMIETFKIITGIYDKRVTKFT